MRDCLRVDSHIVRVSRRGFLKEEGIGHGQRGQQPFRLLIRDGKGRERVEEADIVLDCSGMVVAGVRFMECGPALRLTGDTFGRAQDECRKPRDESGSRAETHLADSSEDVPAFHRRCHGQTRRR